ncbi:MAG: nucleotidyl transferase AbiEii/AbiGii toxin family protein [Acidobacteria bacterium]|nr:nucleotidyl transferase AbiEii/AbiGii toxin family protein [Acidobacteriota bacterium]
METLTLPGRRMGCGPPNEKSSTSLPAEVFGQPIRPHIGGGTTLAARWKHRLSTDIDILLPERNTLIDLLQDDERNVVRRLGGEPEAVTDRRAKIAFTRGRSTVAS